MQDEALGIAHVGQMGEELMWSMNLTGLISALVTEHHHAAEPRLR